MRQQAGRRDAFVDDLRRNRCLNQRFAIFTHPLATDMALDGKHAGRVIQFFADVLTNTFECAATGALRVVRLMQNQRTWKRCWQCSALGLLFFLGRPRHCL
ncbi:Uncharacterized conserved protein [Pseudomonas syringae pv. actinidiae]|uniref:Uncharacterized conserved protein n=1 Tax=Pseudomonas syringae pv. actinidiae TaxID=103796 RepID=A0AAN4QEH9_PSESF|nr:Uncharacterized conserved protein [Pseudomonas syringae pv. actinidiae]